MSLIDTSKKFPNTHLIAGAFCLLALGLTLLLVPSKDVSADREVVALKPLSVSTAPQAASSNHQEPADTTLTIAMIDKQLQPALVKAPTGNTPTAKIQPPPPAPEENWLRIQVRSGDNLTTLFKKAGLGANELYPLINGIKPAKPFDRLMPGQHLEFLIEDGSLQKIKLEKSALHSLLITKAETGYQLTDLQRSPDIRLTQKQGTIEQSLFLAGQQAGLSQGTIMQLAAIFGWDVDFALDIRKGDSFNLIYEELLLDGEIIEEGNIVAATFTNQGATYRAIRYTDSKGDSNFYTPEGDSMRKAFLRTPVDFARISSRFNPNRKHPIFKTNRPHRGVDYAAPTGTPIKSSGDGKVIFSGRKGGYGKAVIVQHGQQYTTLYAHMSRIKAGIKNGKRVKQGQTIGYVGSTGYATGPHLHYEFRVNGVHRNPLTVPLPQANPLPQTEMALFLPQAKELLALLDTAPATQLAAN